MAVRDLCHEYSDNISNSKIAVLGPTPPPLGGVSVHIKRVLHKFSQQNNQVSSFDTTAEYRYRWLPLYLIQLTWWLFLTRPDRVYYHTLYLSNSIWELLLLIAVKKIVRFKIIAIEHDCRHLYKRSSLFKKWFNICMKQIDQLVLIGNITHKSYVDNNVTTPINSSVEAAFLPPDLMQAPKIYATYPKSLQKFLAIKRPLIVANAFQLSLIQGKDLYGIDLCLDMLVALKQEQQKIGLVLALAQVGDTAYFKELYFRIHQLQLQEHIYFLYKQQELWPLLQHADLFVRPTRSDGASVSVQEALYLGIPAIASDVCLRPAGTALFATGHKADFIAKVSEHIKLVC